MSILQPAVSYAQNISNFCLDYDKVTEYQSTSWEDFTASFGDGEGFIYELKPNMEVSANLIGTDTYFVSEPRQITYTYKVYNPGTAPIQIRHVALLNEKQITFINGQLYWDVNLAS